MKPLQKYILLLSGLNILIWGAAYLFMLIIESPVSFGSFVLLSFLFSGINIITIYIFIRGQTKDPESQTLHTLLAIGLKFLLEMFLALVWFILAKKTSLPSVLIFFVLYLTLTLFFLYFILKTLKKRPL